MVTKKQKTERFIELKRTIVPILLQHDVLKASVFDSFAAGTATDFSDLDLLIEFKGEKNLFDLVSLKLTIEAEVKRDVDVLMYRSLNL